MVKEIMDEGERNKVYASRNGTVIPTDPFASAIKADFLNFEII